MDNEPKLNAQGQEVIQVPLQRIRDLGKVILAALIDEGADEEVTFGLLAMALVIGRVTFPTNASEMTEDQEVKFMQDTMDWALTYWGDKPLGSVN